MTAETDAVAELRVARRADLSGLRRLAEDFYREDGFGTEPDVLATNLAHLIDFDATLVAVIEEADGALGGFAVTTTSFGLENGLVAELEDLYVVPHRRRQGLATRLIEHSAAWAHGRGCRKLAVVIAPNGLDVRHLHRYYEARSFVDEGRTLRTRTLG